MVPIQSPLPSTDTQCVWCKKDQVDLAGHGKEPKRSERGSEEDSGKRLSGGHVDVVKTFRSGTVKG